MIQFAILTHSYYLKRSFLALPDAFISPRAWQVHVELLSDIISNAVAPTEGTPVQSAQALQQTFQDLFADVKRRNEAMLFRRLPPRVVGSLTSALSDIKVGRISPADAYARSIGFAASELALRRYGH